MKYFFRILLLATLVALTFGGRGRTSSVSTTVEDSSSSDTSSTDTSSTDTSSYQDTVKTLIDSGECATVETDYDSCEDQADAVSYYETFEYGNYRVIITSGSPNHPSEDNIGMLQDDGELNPNRRCSRWRYVTLPLNPVKDSYRESEMGTVGYAESGGVIFNHLSAPDGSLALYNEGDTLDECYGHSNEEMQYHYHG